MSSVILIIEKGQLEEYSKIIKIIRESGIKESIEKSKDSLKTGLPILNHELFPRDWEEFPFIFLQILKEHENNKIKYFAYLVLTDDKFNIKNREKYYPLSASILAYIISNRQISMKSFEENNF
jgi:hypothetical protein